jgi:hypothetical protein
MLDPTPLKQGEQYVTVAHIRDCDDLPKLPITPSVTRNDGTQEPLWTHTDGTPMKILVRALSFAERRKINQEAKDDNDQFALLTCLYGIEQPKFTKEQLEVIESKHPAAVDAIAETIHSLCQFPASMVERELRRLSELPAEPPSEPEK